MGGETEVRGKDGSSTLELGRRVFMCHPRGPTEGLLARNSSDTLDMMPRGFVTDRRSDDLR